MKSTGMRKAFTLVELLVVITIMIIMMALLLPVGKSMLVSNQVMTCAGNLHKIQQSLKMYYTDYQGVPPVWIAGDGSGTPYSVMTSASAAPVDPGSGQPTNPLWALYTQQYLRDKSCLHCPADIVNTDPTVPAYYESYTGAQPSSTPAAQSIKVTYQNDQDNSDSWNGQSIAVNRFPYMPCRLFKVTPGDPHTWKAAPTVYTLQQEISKGMTSVTVNGQQYWAPIVDSTWMPSDNTVITWCGNHAINYTKNGIPQVQALFWDGSVQMMSEYWLVQGTNPGPPPAAWEVTPNDQ